MTATLTETSARRRNAYPDHCCVCGTLVESEAGWLYLDLGRRRRFNSNGRVAKKVKCDRCHQNKLAHKWQVANLENPRPRAQVWSVAQVCRWPLEITTKPSVRFEHRKIDQDGQYNAANLHWVPVPFMLVVVHVTVNGEATELAGPNAIDGSQGNFAYRYQYGQTAIGGRTLSRNAADKLVARVKEAIADASTANT